MSEEEHSYRQIVKTTSLFGGVQVYNILIQIIRSKVIALLLGPEGMGVIGLFNTASMFITNLTNFGLGTSAVKNISEANASGNAKRVSTSITVLQRLVWGTGLLGTLVTIFFSPWISQLTFGNKDYTIAFIWISVSLLFTQLSSGQLALLQGMRKLRYLAMANLAGSSLSLGVTLPLYYFWGLDGIVPGIIGSSIVVMAASYFFSHRVPVLTVSISASDTLKEGKSMLKMGFLISLSGLLTLAASYIIRVYIRKIGGLDEVGLYTAGFAIINSYVGLIFSAMSSDYYPRLSAVASDAKKCIETVNQQAEIAILILAPILVVFMTFINGMVILLYSRDFVAVNGMLYWTAMGMYFKVASWTIGFIFLAKSDSKLFFWNELISNINMLVLNLLGYHYFGLTGLGISFAIAYLLYLVQVYVISKIKYKFSFNKSFWQLFTVQFILGLAAFLTINYLSQPYTYLIGTVLFAISGWISLKELDKRIGIKQVIENFKNKHSKH